MTTAHATRTDLALARQAAAARAWSDLCDAKLRKASGLPLEVTIEELEENYARAHALEVTAVEEAQTEAMLNSAWRVLHLRADNAAKGSVEARNARAGMDALMTIRTSLMAFEALNGARHGHPGHAA